MKGKSFGFELRIFVFGCILVLMVAFGLLSACRKGEKLTAGLPHDSAGVAGGAHAGFPGAPDSRIASSITGPGGDEFSFEPLDGDGSYDKHGGDAYKLALKDGKEGGGKDGSVVLTISTNKEGEWKYVLGNLYYNAEKWNPVDFEKGGMFEDEKDEKDLVIVPFYNEKAKFGFWIGLPNFDKKDPKKGGDVCNITFENSAWDPPKGPSVAPDDAGDAVFDLTQVEENGRYIAWGEVNRGDGNRSGDVWVPDLTPIAVFDTDTISQWPMKDPVDYNNDGTIDGQQPSADYDVWYESSGDGEVVDGYKVFMRETENGSVVHTVTIPGPDSSLRSSKFTYVEGPPETESELPNFYKPSGFYWTGNGAVGYVCKLTEDDSQNSIDEGTWWISVKPYDGNNVGTESARQEITIDDNPYVDRLYLQCADTGVSDGDTVRIQIWIEENEKDLYAMPACRVEISQDTNSNIINWYAVNYHDYSGSDPRPFFQDMYDQDLGLAFNWIGWNPPLYQSADDRTADMNFTFYPTPSYGVATGTTGYVGYIDIPTNSTTSGEFTVGLIEQSGGQTRCYYLFSNSTSDKEYFNILSTAPITITVS